MGDNNVEVVLDMPGGSFTPLFVEMVQAEHEGAMDSIMDQCGYTETRRTGDRNWEVTVEGVLGPDQAPMLASVTSGDEAGITTSLYSGPIEVKNVLMREEHDMNAWIDATGTEEWPIFVFQLQAREPEPA